MVLLDVIFVAKTIPLPIHQKNTYIKKRRKKNTRRIKTLNIIVKSANKSGFPVRVFVPRVNKRGSVDNAGALMKTNESTARGNCKAVDTVARRLYKR